jgi:hypothetical protein
MVLTEYSIECNIIALVYINRITVRNKMAVTMNNWRGLWLGAIILAQKVWDDKPLKTSSFCLMIPDLKKDAVIALEVKCFSLLDYSTTVRPSVYAKYFFELHELFKEITGTMSKGYNWLLQPLSIAEKKKLETRSHSHTRDYRDYLKEQEKKNNRRRKNRLMNLENPNPNPNDNTPLADPNNSDSSAVVTPPFSAGTNDKNNNNSNEQETMTNTATATTVSSEGITAEEEEESHNINNNDLSASSASQPLTTMTSSRTNNNTTSNNNGVIAGSSTSSSSVRSSVTSSSSTTTRFRQHFRLDGTPIPTTSMTLEDATFSSHSRYVIN